MRRIYLIILILLLPYVIVAQDIPKTVVELIKSSTRLNDGMHIVYIQNKEFEVSINNKSIKSIKRRIIQDDLRNNIDSAIVDYLEEAYAAHLLNVNNPKFNDIEITQGNWTSFEKLDTIVECNLVYNDFKYITISLKSDTDVLCMSFPIDYQKFNNGSRTEIENQFIDGLLSYKVKKTRNLPLYFKEDLIDIGNDNFLLKGSTYLISTVNNNSYLSKDDKDSLRFIVNPKQPIATLSNMIITGAGYPATLNMSISTHEYGSKTTLSVPLEQFLQYCIIGGCEIYWGYEKLESNILYGTIFCYNPKQGYDHIIHLYCDIENLGEDNFEIHSRVSLFVPTTNIQNLFEEYSRH